MKNCECCGFETENLHSYGGESQWLCELCAKTEVSYFNRNGEIKPDTIILLRTLCYLTNAIIASNEKIFKKVEDISLEQQGLKRI